MLSLLSRSVLGATPLARPSLITASTCYRAFATANVPTGGKLARSTGKKYDWATLDQTVYGRARQAKQETSPVATAAESWATMSKEALARLGPPPGKYAGRSVEVVNGDIATALRQLNGILFENRVHAERARNARHEKKGYKRRRLASERWRRRFAHEVRTKVELVKTIRRRGA